MGKNHTQRFTEVSANTLTVEMIPKVEAKCTRIKKESGVSKKAAKYLM